MTGYQPLDITVIYSDDGRISPKVRRTATVGVVNHARLAGCLSLLISAAWLFVVWFPVDSYLYMCLVRRAPISIAESVNLQALLFGRPPPAEYAIGKAPDRAAPDTDAEPVIEDEGDSSAFRSASSPTPAPPQPAASADFDDGASGRRRLPHAVYAWLAVMTAAGLGLALAGGASVGHWFGTPQAARPAQLFAMLSLLAVGFLAYRYWPKDGTAVRMPELMQQLAAAGCLVAAGALAMTSAPRAAGRMFGLVLAVLVAGGWLLWGRYATGLPEVGQRMGMLILMVPTALLGAALARAARGTQGLAVVLVVCAALATAAGLAYGQKIGGFVDFAPTSATYAKAAALCGCGLVPLLWARLAAR